MPAAWCEQCEEYHVARCYRTTADRRRQNREAQRRYREKRKAERAAAGDVSKLKARIAELEVDLRAANDCIDFLKREPVDVSILDPKLPPKKAWRSAMMIVHPDKHNGADEANRLAKLVNAEYERKRK